MFKVCMVSTGSSVDRIPYSYMGIHKFITGLSRELSNHGCEVVILTRKFPGLPDRETIGPVIIRRINVLTTFERLSQPEFALRVIPTIRKLHTYEEFDIIHVHSRVPGASCALLKRELGTKLIYTEQYWDVFLTEPGQIYDPLTYYILLLCERITMEGSDKVFAVSHTLKEAICRKLPCISNKVLVIPNAVDTRDLKPSDFEMAKRHYGLSDEKVVLYVGRLVPEKGLKELLKAMKFVIKNVPNIKLLVVGEGRFVTELQLVSKELGLSDYVIFLGRRVGERLKRLYDACDLLVLPSWGEAMPTVVLEAMAFGKAVIGTKVAGTSEAIVHGKTGLLVNVGDIKELADAMVTLLSNPELCREMGREGRKRVEEFFSFKAVAKRYLEEYKVLVGA